MAFIINTAQNLHTAARKATPIAQISSQAKFNLEQAYAIQEFAMQLRYREGEKLVGLKMGFTSTAKMQQMGVHDMIWGRLTDAMLVQNGGSITFSKFIHPRAEPEIAFKISKEITTELTLEECYEVVDGIAAAIEIIDSRYQNFKFSLNDVIADNCSSAAFVVGDWQKPEQQISDLGMKLLFDDAVVAEGSSADILGNPWLSLQAATRLAAQYNQPIAAGSIILAGAATNAEFVKSGMQVSATVSGFGPVGFSVV